MSCTHVDPGGADRFRGDHDRSLQRKGRERERDERVRKAHAASVTRDFEQRYQAQRFGPVNEFTQPHCCVATRSSFVFYESFNMC